MEVNMKFDIIKIIELLRDYGYELDIISAEENRIRIKVRSGESYSSKTIDLNTEIRYAGDPNDIIYRRILEVIMNLKIFEDDYIPMHCSCGGLLYDKRNGKDPYFRCIRCEKTYPSWPIKCCQIGIDSMTGWRFPMIKRKKEEVEK
jgi:hypothetical protein